jgi:hypothetical protein
MKTSHFTRVRLRWKRLVGSCLCACFCGRSAELNVPSEYPTIQAAINAAASGDTIRIAAGDYYEQALITNGSLTILGEPGATLHAWEPGMQQILLPFNATSYPLLACVSSDVTIRGLTFDGGRLGDAYPHKLFGLVFRGAGGRVENCTIRGFTGNTQTDTRGVSIVNPAGLATLDIEVSIVKNSFSDNILSLLILGDTGINAGRVRTKFTIEGNTFTSSGPSEITAQAIRIRSGASGVVRDNIIRNYSYNGGQMTFACGIAAYEILQRRFFPLQPIRIEANIFATNDHHAVIIGGADSEISNNLFDGSDSSAQHWGGLTLSGTNMIVAQNNFSNLPRGVYVFAETDFLPTGLLSQARQLSNFWAIGSVMSLNACKLEPLQQD